MNFRAAVLHQPGRPMTIETVDAADLRGDDVLVRIRATSLCHTDLEVVEGQLVYPMPIVLGHEASGIVEAVGPGAEQRVRVGEHVVLSWNPRCGRCFYCEQDEPILCETYVGLGPKGVQFDGTSRLELNGHTLHTMFYTSSFAEYAIVSAGCAVPVPREIPFDRACLIGCGVMTGVGAATWVARIAYGEAVLVIGCGAVGLSSVQGARLAGAGIIVAVDLNDDRLELAMRVGATHVLNAQRDDPVAAVKALTAGRGADCVLESAGNARAFRLSVETCRPGGRVVWLGKVGLDEQVAFRWGSLMGEKGIRRSSYGGARPQRDFPLLARSYLQGKLQLDPYISRRLRLEEINDGFAALRRGEGIRSVITFDAR